MIIFAFLILKINTISIAISYCYLSTSLKPEPVFVNVYGAQGIDSEESISPAYVVWRAGTKNRVVVPARQAGNRYLVSLKDLQIPAQSPYLQTF
jgi:hypothetical protein